MLHILLPKIMHYYICLWLNISKCQWFILGYVEVTNTAWLCAFMCIFLFFFFFPYRNGCYARNSSSSGGDGLAVSRHNFGPGRIYLVFQYCITCLKYLCFFFQCQSENCLVSLHRLYFFAVRVTEEHKL